MHFFMYRIVLILRCNIWNNFIMVKYISKTTLNHIFHLKYSVKRKK